MAEHWFGGGIRYRDLVYINLGEEGISAGIILDDKILNGYQDYIGQIGHMVIQKGGNLCNCGKTVAVLNLIGSCALALQQLLKSPDSDILAAVALSTGKTM